jgi:hypothetical protein
VEVQDVIALIPHKYAEMAGLFVAAVIALRTALRGLAWFVRALDVALDDRVDWAWPDKLTGLLNWLDSKVDLAVISALLPKPKTKGGAQ